MARVIFSVVVLVAIAVLIVLNVGTVVPFSLFGFPLPEVPVIVIAIAGFVARRAVLVPVLPDAHGGEGAPRAGTGRERSAAGTRAGGGGCRGAGLGARRHGGRRGVGRQRAGSARASFVLRPAVRRFRIARPCPDGGVSARPTRVLPSRKVPAQDPSHAAERGAVDGGAAAFLRARDVQPPEDADDIRELAAPIEDGMEAAALRPLVPRLGHASPLQPAHDRGKVKTGQKLGDAGPRCALEGELLTDMLSV